MTHLVLYDGVCGLCDGFVRFLIRIDRHDRLRFAALQGSIGTAILEQAGRRTDALSTVIVVADHGTAEARLLDRSDAALFAIAAVGGGWRATAGLRVIPRFARDAVYDTVARTRYRIFGRFDACPIPSASTRAKFLDFATSPRGSERS